MTSRAAERTLGTTAEVLAALAPIKWASSLHERIVKEARRAQGIRLIEPLLFEARYAIALHEAEVQALYEHRTGVRESSVDFLIPGIGGGPSWLVELVSIRESTHVRTATVTEPAGRGIVIETLSLSSDNENPRATPAAEIIRVIEKIGEKVWDARARQPTKFPEPSDSYLHLVLVDMRGFEGVGEPDSSHLLQIAYGSDDPRVELPVSTPETGEPILGLFHPRNVRQAAVVARQRLHYLAFVSEATFAPGEMRDQCRFFRNSQLLREGRIADYYPLRRKYRGATR